eukprot:TRINITY_DN986_c0_g2_i1.p2 TRINITY_DN986_c0_g2~~TRINITY_DN986_c0_g2_i1.p2  ORF type:complete len:209 (+),score=0.97 TRINITY_DN986_c0_g2_i1:3-629(+)
MAGNREVDLAVLAEEEEEEVQAKGGKKRKLDSPPQSAATAFEERAPRRGDLLAEELAGRIDWLRMFMAGNREVDLAVLAEEEEEEVQAKGGKKRKLDSPPQSAATAFEERAPRRGDLLAEELAGRIDWLRMFMAGNREVCLAVLAATTLLSAHLCGPIVYGRWDCSRSLYFGACDSLRRDLENTKFIADMIPATIPGMSAFWLARSSC